MDNWKLAELPLKVDLETKNHVLSCRSREFCGYLLAPRTLRIRYFENPIAGLLNDVTVLT